MCPIGQCLAQDIHELFEERIAKLRRALTIVFTQTPLSTSHALTVVSHPQLYAFLLSLDGSKIAFETRAVWDLSTAAGPW
jgi:uncharacterized protein YecE (DUF72 family)